MNSFSFGPGLIIRREFDVLEWEGKRESTIYFRSLESNERLAMSEEKFFAEFRQGILTVVDAVSTRDSISYAECSSDEHQHSDATIAQLPIEHQRQVLRRLGYVRGVLSSGISRGRTELMLSVIREQATQMSDPKPPSPKTVWRWIKCYQDAKNDLTSLISRHLQRGCSERVTAIEEQDIQDAIDEWYMTSNRTSVRGAYLLYCGKVLSRPVQARQSKRPVPVSYSTFARRIAKRPPYDVDAARYGVQYARRKYRMLRGHFPEVHPLDYVEIDHSPMNVFVVDDRINLPLGSPVVTAIKDRGTDMLLGMYVTFSAPSVNSVFGAIRHSLSSHAEALRMWPEIQNPWPSFGLGRTYVSDRGAEFLSTAYQVAIASLGAEYQYCARRTPWHKPSIERFFGMIESTMYERFPSRSFASLGLRGDHDPRRARIIKFSSFVYLLHKWAADVHNASPHSRTGISPLERWSERIALAPPQLPASLDQLDAIFGIHHRSTISTEGLRYKYLNFSNNYLSDLMNRVGVGQVIEYVVVPDDLGFIYVLDPFTKKNVPVPNTRPTYASGLSLFQHDTLVRLCREKKNKVEADLLPEIRTSFAMEVAEHLGKSGSRFKRQIARFAGIDSGATIRGEQRSVLDVVQLNSGEESRERRSKDQISVTTNVKRPSWGITVTDVGSSRIRGLNDEH